MIYSLLLKLALLSLVLAIPEQGKWQFNVKKKSCNYFHVNKALFQGSHVSLKVLCDPSKSSQKDMKIRIGWTIRESPCFEEYIGPDISMPDYLRYYYSCPASLIGDYGYDRVQYLKTTEVEVTCDHLVDQFLKPESTAFKTEIVGGNGTRSCTYPPMFACDATPPPPMFNYVNFENFRDDSDISENRRKRSLQSPPIFSAKKSPTDLDEIYIPNDGVYLFILFMKSVDPSYQFDASVSIEMRNKDGYLSANDAPLLKFYGFMCALYVGYALVWLIVSAMQWRDLLRIQFWIAAVIFLGMLEKAVFFAEYQSINSTGQSVKGAVLFAEVVSCLKRTLARMLVIIVSLGYGIVKPRLGQMLHRVVCVGTLYFVMSVAEVTLRIYKPKNEPPNQTLMADIPLAVLDSIICWWIFSSLVQTMRTLRLRRNLVKLQLYRKFTNSLIIAVIASFIFMVGIIKQHKITSCLIDWDRLWLDQAYWHLLFSFMLLVIMILWRPTNNNQRYAFTQLLDETDDEDEPNDLATAIYDGLTLRQQIFGNKDGTNEKDSIIEMNQKLKNSEGDDEEDVRWSKQNVPTSLVDAALPVLVDSEDELLNSRFERNKME